MSNYVMRPDTLDKIAAYKADICRINGAKSTGQAFSVAPSVAQSIETRVQESSEFLSLINVVEVDEESGEKLMIGVSQPIAYRAPTSSTRNPIDPITLDASGYFCRKTDFDTQITYRTLDQWAKFPDFQKRVRDAILKRVGLDRIMIGWNGQSAADTTNRVTNPLLQDVNIGWLKKLRDAAPARVINQIVPGSNKVLVGMTGDYADIDALVLDVFNNIIDPWHRESQLGFVAIMGADLNADSRFPMLNSTMPASEMMAADIIRTSGKVGGLPVVHVPFFPAKSLFITPISNLSIYWQRGTRRRRIVENPARDRIEDYQSVNEAYVIEDYGQCALIENIQFVS